MSWFLKLNVHSKRVKTTFWEDEDKESVTSEYEVGNKKLALLWTSAPDATLNLYVQTPYNFYVFMCLSILRNHPVGK